MRRFSGRLIVLVSIIGLLSLLLRSDQPVNAFYPVSEWLLQTNTPTPTSQLTELFRTVEHPVGVRVENVIRLRSEAGTGGGSATVIRTAQPGETFDIRQGVEWTQADGYTWIPISIDGQDAWAAQEGFLQLVDETVEVPISQAEVDMTFNAELPLGIVKAERVDGKIQAVDENGEAVSVWNWGNEYGQGHWTSAIDPNTLTFTQIGYGEDLDADIIAQLTSPERYNRNVRPLEFSQGVRAFQIPPRKRTISPELVRSWGFKEGDKIFDTELVEFPAFFVGVVPGRNAPIQQYMVLEIITHTNKEYAANYVALVTGADSQSNWRTRFLVSTPLDQNIEQPDFFANDVHAYAGAVQFWINDRVFRSETNAETLRALKALEPGTEVWNRQVINDCANCRDETIFWQRVLQGQSIPSLRLNWSNTQGAFIYSDSQ